MTGPGQRMLLLPAQCHRTTQAHGLALARQRNISSLGIIRGALLGGSSSNRLWALLWWSEWWSGGPLLVAEPVELHCGTVGASCQSCSFFFTATARPMEARGLWPLALWDDLDSLGPWRYGISRSDLGAPLMGVDLRCLQRKRQTRKWCGFAVHSYCCLFPVWSVLAAPAFSTSDEPHPIDSLACLLLLVIVYGTGLYWFADMF